MFLLLDYRALVRSVGGVSLSESGLAILLDIDKLLGVFLSLWAGGACGILERTLSLLQIFKLLDICPPLSMARHT